jgi:phosphoglycerol geranylgeranyltransferase
MAYLIIEPGATAGWVGNAKLLPREKPKLTAAYALTAEMYGFRMIYLEAGSGGNRIPPSHISLTSRVVSIPVIAGGGVRTREDARKFVEAGADIVVMGTFIEDNVLEDEGECLVPIIDEIKAAGREQKKNFKKVG